MNRPFVFINVAMTVDGKIDTVQRCGAAISSMVDKARMDNLRAGADAIMVGGRTLLDEDPKLTVKSAELRAERAAKGLSENPIKVGVVSRAEIKPDSNFLTAGPARVVVFTSSQTSPEQVNALKSSGVDVFNFGEKRVDLYQTLEMLKSLGVKRLMVEGGATLNFELLRLGLVDELIVYIAPLIFGGDTAPTLANGTGLMRSAAIPLKLADAQVLDEDGGVLLRYVYQKIENGEDNDAYTPPHQTITGRKP
jgi:2,5-diamino-6-(ribosylamino)-4(3H)-pyrimidinone 5'-phosphate reductase